MSKLSIIVPIFGAFRETRDLLLTLRATTRHKDPEIIFVDDATPDPRMKAWLIDVGQTGIRLLRHDTNQGFGQSCATGVEAAIHDCIVFLNSDLLLTHGWLEPLVDAFESDDDLAILGNTQIAHSDGRVDHLGKYFDEDGIPRHLDKRLLPDWHQRHSSPSSLPCPTITAACWMLEKSTFEQLNGFDEVFVNGFEDDDFCLRADRDLGAKTACSSSSIVYHHISQSPGRKDSEDANTAHFIERWSDYTKQWHKDHFESWLEEARARISEKHQVFTLEKNLQRS